MSKKLIKGNEAIVYASINAGCRFYAGYPITPQNEIPELMSHLMPKAGGIFIQAEAETAAVNMVFGASATGTRSMTTSSSPGISLMQEGISYLAGAELPCVIVNMVRGGPGLGNIRASQADYFQSVKSGGHGDYRLIVLAPSSPQELYDLTMLSFDYADLYKNPVLILGDGIIGQMIEPVELKPYKKREGLPSKDSWTLTGCKNREPHIIKTLLLNPADLLVKHNIKLQKKYDLISRELCLCDEYSCEDADIILAAYGTSARVCREVVDEERKKGNKVGLVNPITLWPFPKKIFQKYIGKDILVVEMSHGQFIEDVKLSMECKANFHFLGYGGGWYPDVEQIQAKIEEIKNVN